MNLLKTIQLILSIVIVLHISGQVAVKKRGPVTGLYRITEVADTNFHLLKVGDIIEISSTKGFVHHRKGKLLHHYKMKPITIITKRVAPCIFPPCPEFKDTIPAFYVEAMKRIIMISDLSSKSYLNITEARHDVHTAQIPQAVPIHLGCVMKKIKIKKNPTNTH